MNLTKKTTYKADFVKAQKSADDVLKNSTVKELPVRVKQIANSFPNLKVRTYSWFAKKRGFSHKEVCNLVNSDEGCCLYYESLDEYLILYNDKITNKGRKRWTLAHELGHYVMNHNKNSNNSSLARSSLTEDEYNEFESEANCFARELLAPPPVLNELNLISPSNISNICDISSEASANVSKFLRQGAQFGIKYPPHNPLLKQFFGFINKIKNGKKCNECNFTFSELDAEFCPSCGSLRLDEILNSNVVLHFNEIDCLEHEVKQCFNCNNLDIIIGSNYCMICGNYLINKCTGFDDAKNRHIKKSIKWHAFDSGCGELLDSGSRFCHKCGSTSTFLEDGILKHWRKT
jgi:Zn-dependent peptidase ImmA (M78 family)